MQAQVESDGPTVDALHKKIRKLEHELDRKSTSEPADKRSVLKEDKVNLSYTIVRKLKETFIFLPFYV